ncbi:MAG: dihydrofolate reductase family protein [Nitrospinota bacterium]|nr:dihydrofolate reductase family protein [Nitrospinota bacterium]
MNSSGLSVSVNMAMTLDGKISSFDGTNLNFGSKEDRKEMDRLRSETDIIIWGAETLRIADCPAKVRDEEFVNYRLDQGKAMQPASGVITKTGNIPKTSKWFNNELRQFIFTGISGERKARDSSAGRAEIIVFPTEEVSPSSVLEYLKKQDFKKVLLEGGGSIHWSFIKENLIDFLHITVVPLLVGGSSSPTLLDGEGFLCSNFIDLELEKFHKKGNELFLKYNVLKNI